MYLCGRLGYPECPLSSPSSEVDWVARVLEQLGWEDLGPSPLARWFNRPDGKLTWLPYNLGYEADGFGWWLESNGVDPVEFWRIYEEVWGGE